MAFKRASTIVGPPANALAEALESVTDDELQTVAEYNAQSYELLYVSERVAEKHGGLDGVEEETDSLFDYYHIDFLERDLLEDILWLGEVRYHARPRYHHPHTRVCSGLHRPRHHGPHRRRADHPPEDLARTPAVTGGWVPPTRR